LDEITFAVESYSMLVPVIPVMVKVTVPVEMLPVEVIAALPPVPVAALKPLFTIAPVKFPVTVAALTTVPVASTMFTVALDLNLVPEATQVIVMLCTCTALKVFALA
jgi:hypothetical protein